MAIMGRRARAGHRPARRAEAGGPLRILAILAAFVARQRGHLFGWVPVCLAIGIGGFFGLPIEPGRTAILATAGLCALAALAARRAPEALAPMLAGLALIAAGGLLAAARTHAVAEPPLSFRYYGPVEGRIVGIDRSASDNLRLTLADVVLDDVRPERTPPRVRVSLHGQQGFVDPQPGLPVMMTAHLSPPQGPVEPGGFDFRRHAWFQGLGAVGYTRTPVLATGPVEGGGLALRLTAWRMALSGRIQTALPGQTGAFAAAVLTGDRSGLTLETVADMRDSNLSHLLAISGLHMGLLTGFVFTLVRAGIALIPPLALRVPSKKWAAVGALAAATIYLGLSGGNIATQRAYIMVAVMLCAVLLDRRALTLRAVAFAATLVLLLRPEALTGPGFQMSFAATTALVWVFSNLRTIEATRVPRWLRPVMGVVVSSAVAGLATAPIAAAHFNRAATYGLIANLVSVPVMGSLVIPTAVVSALVAPLGLWTEGMQVMGFGIAWILGVANTVAGFEGAVRHIVSPGPWVLPLFSLGALSLILVRGPARLAGLAGILAAFVIWGQGARPTVLLAQSGGIAGYMTGEGRALTKPRGDGFVVRNWLENDGDAATPEEAAARGLTGQGAVAGLNLRVLTGAQARSGPIDCAGADLVIAPEPLDPRPGCTVLGADILDWSGPIAIRQDGDALRIATARAASGDRAWNRAGRRVTDRQEAAFEARLTEMRTRLQGVPGGQGAEAPALTVARRTQ